MLISGLAYGGWWYNNYQAEQTEKLRQQEIAQESEQKAWEQAQTQNSTAGYQLYLKTWPEGVNKTRAEQGLSNLVENVRLAKLSDEEKRKEQIKHIQDYLNRLGYQAPSNGVLDKRTEGNIRAFEKSQNLIETGAADDVLVKALKARYEELDNKAWAKAKDLHTAQAYTVYLNAHPKGRHVDQVAMQKEKAEEERLETISKAKAEKMANEEAAKNMAKKKAEEERVQQVKAEQVRLLQLRLNKSTQIELNRIGYAVGKADGTLGNKTKKAIRHYQKGNKLTATGETSDTLLVHLKRSTKKPRLVGETFKDCSNCPEMVVIPAGTFQMGSADGGNNEKPIHRVNISSPFAMSKYEIRWNEYQHCIDAGVCESELDAGFGKGNRPIINVSWDDAQIYAKWLSKKTGKQYRLPSEAEWEYSARAGSTTKYSWGNNLDCNKAQYDGGSTSDCSSKKSDLSKRGTARVGSFSANAFGLYDVHGNVREWVQDCYINNYNKTPNDGRVIEGGVCDYRVLRGGSWDFLPVGLRSANRNYNSATTYDKDIGFRLAQDL